MIFIILCCVLLVYLLKTAGLIIAIIIGIGAFISWYYRPNYQEVTTLRASILLSVEDIQEVLNQYQKFSFGNDADSIADRTLYRPELINKNSRVSAISAFHDLYSASENFISRVHVKLEEDLDAAQLKSLLYITDRRAQELQQAWIMARQAALTLNEE
ncbi:hypothetical protein [Corynebacterium sp. sy039]|uniref:hypothetical protein n=1 Tax=Corynebacterium sp. sy039 TaxID=2599641 RepID=UPI001FED52E5|nr:hypothetical protein [Corynebacterium sp. sy039]